MSSAPLYSQPFPTLVITLAQQTQGSLGPDQSLSTSLPLSSKTPSFTLSLYPNVLSLPLSISFSLSLSLFLSSSISLTSYLQCITL